MRPLTSTARERGASCPTKGAFEIHCSSDVIFQNLTQMSLAQDMMWSRHSRRMSETQSVGPFGSNWLSHGLRWVIDLDIASAANIADNLRSTRLGGSCGMARKSCP
jgi:hypothetical protein